MQTNLKPIKSYLITSLGIIAVIIGLLQYVGQEHLMLVSNVLSLVIAIPFIALSLFLVAKNKTTGSFGKAWICFAVFAVSWSVAEFIWAADELVYKEDPFPSEADFFWLLGYPAYFVFAMMYIKPFKSSVSSKTILLAASVSAALMGFLVYYATTKSSLPMFETILLSSYPIGDAICLAPTIIGLVLFFRGQVNFTWLLLLVGMFSFVIADAAYQILSQNNQYYTGNPFDVLYLWAYVFFVFGAYYHTKVFRVKSQLNDQEKLR